MPRYSKSLLKYIGRKLGLAGRSLDDLSRQFDELPAVIGDNWLAGFGDIKANEFLRKAPRLTKHGEQAGLRPNAAGDFFGPYVSQASGTQIAPHLRAMTGAGPEVVLHEGMHNLDNALYSMINRTFNNDKSFFLPVFENIGQDITIGLPPLPSAAPLQAFGAKAKARPDLVMSAISRDPHGAVYFSRGSDLNWEKVAQEGIAQMFQRARPFSASPAYRNVIEVVEANPLTRYDITFDNLFRTNDAIPETKPIFVSRAGHRLNPTENSVYVDILRQIPEDGIKPIDIKEKQMANRPYPVSRADSRGQGSTHWQSLKDNKLIEMRNRRAYVTGEGRRLLDELKRASEVQPDKVRYGGLYNDDLTK